MHFYYAGGLYIIIYMNMGSTLLEKNRTYDASKSVFDNDMSVNPDSFLGEHELIIFCSNDL